MRIDGAMLVELAYEVGLMQLRISHRRRGPTALHRDIDIAERHVAN